MLIVNTDHGFLMGEHDWWAKVAMPYAKARKPSTTPHLLYY
jgi:hypothetical protein